MLPRTQVERLDKVGVKNPSPYLHCYLEVAKEGTKWADEIARTRSYQSPTLS